MSLHRTVCSRCGTELGPGYVNFCTCGGMSEIEYDLDAVAIRDSTDSYERFGDLLPVDDRTLLPTAQPTPLLHAVRLGEEVGLSRLYLKDETVLPTGTTKDRMAAVALAYLYECGVRRFCASSTGNSSTALARAIGRHPEMSMSLFTAEEFAGRVHLPESREQVTHFVLRDASFVDTERAAAAFSAAHGLAAERGFFNPARREGLKLAWLEAVDQAPDPIDWYVQAVSSAMGVCGVHRGALQLKALGRIPHLPRLACIQQESCAPMVAAWEAGSPVIRPHDVVERPAGIASAILRGDPRQAYPYVREAVIESEGTFAAVSGSEILEARDMAGELEGVLPCPSAAAALAGAIKLRRTGRLPAGDSVLVNLTGREREPVEPAGAVWLERSGDGWVPSRPEPARR